MSPEEALKLLDDICAQVKSDRAGHLRMQEAVEVLAAAIRKPKGLRQPLHEGGEEGRS